MDLPKRFEAPDAWAGKFAAFAKKSGVSKKYASFEAASSLASAFFDPALSGSVEHEGLWDFVSLHWLRKD